MNEVKTPLIGASARVTPNQEYSNVRGLISCGPSLGHYFSPWQLSRRTSQITFYSNVTMSHRPLFKTHLCLRMAIFPTAVSECCKSCFRVNSSTIQADFLIKIRQSGSSPLSCYKTIFNELQNRETLHCCGQITKAWGTVNTWVTIKVHGAE